MFEALPEAKRLAYLQAMGVESFFPRFRLPGAPEPVLCDTLPAPEEMAAQAPADAQNTPREARVAPETARNLLRDLVEQKPAQASTPKPAPAVTGEPKPEKLQFSLRFYQVPGLALLVDASPEQVPETALKQFAANLMLALSRRQKAWQGSIKQSLQQHLFRWPVVGNQTLAQGAHEAQEAVNAAILANCERNAVPLVLLMGANAQRFAGELGELNGINTEAIAHYLQTPLAKQILWTQLTSAK